VAYSGTPKDRLLITTTSVWQFESGGRNILDWLILLCAGEALILRHDVGPSLTGAEVNLLAH
jgi:hypothetical protein